ncbi:hypothetical protein [Vibrio sp. 10N.261.55.A7]|uniref:hypothetical protein n=1 Tax=Vibrio sp. 10N.261.55.A7 TaxID=1880851 RepID=UPI000C84B10F|nr:hypothetical protein [Vibrio sp. 10N.261.55.A7]PMK03948.1 hypothetical protein BCU12_16370 [Vibrio sp. 10N.261.55.A7]
MVDQNVGHILQAFNSIGSKLLEQNAMIKELTVKVNSLESQNKQLVQLVQQLKTPSPTMEQSGVNKSDFQDKVTQSLSSIEDKSKKAIELIKANSGQAKKRAWP